MERYAGLGERARLHRRPAGLLGADGLGLTDYVPTASGFYCPGREFDDESHGAKRASIIASPQRSLSHLPFFYRSSAAGGLPLAVTVGRTTELVLTDPVNTTTTEVRAVRVTFTLDADTYDATAFKAQLALEYGVPVSAISLSATAGSVVVSVVIDVASSSDAATTASAIVALDQASLTSAIGAALSLNLTMNSPVVVSLNVTTTTWTETSVEVDCPPGWWCSAGGSTPCERGFWSATVNAQNASACERCSQDQATTALAGATSPSQCLCLAGEYMDRPDIDDPLRWDCVECPDKGTACTDDGATLERLPLSGGWWRVTAASTELLECTPSAACIGGTPPQSARANDTVWADYICATGYRGAKCSKCSEGFYADSVRNCKKCDGSEWTAWLLFAVCLSLAGAVFGVILLRGDSTNKQTESHKEPGCAEIFFARLISRVFRFQIKLRILVAMYEPQIEHACRCVGKLD